MLWLTLCGPAVAVLAALLLATAFRGTRGLVVWPLWSVWLPAILIFVFFWPLGAAKRLAATRVPRNSRRAAARRVALPAIIVNSVVAVAAVFAFIAMI